ncbi:MAG: hypothetical protein ACLTCP_09595 [Ruminococcus bicirculans (ex Wegman et al. 2014)]|uniref:hypothetical protein n=1 Tax=uncultured Ruminococcus sp. TaxID=165186 RepID=UPI002593A29A|nr:hypothetical protein [uncultured Ruminococcus sp.]
MSFEHPANAPDPMFVILFGSVILVRFVHPEKAYHQMFSTLFGIVMLVIFSQPENAVKNPVTFFPSIVLGITTFPPLPVYLVISIVSSFNTLYSKSFLLVSALAVIVKSLRVRLPTTPGKANVPSVSDKASTVANNFFINNHSNF